VPEYARLYQEKHNRPLTYRDVTPIGRGQLKLEQIGRQQARRLLICDTDLLETKVYSEAYYGRVPAWLLAAVPQHYADLYLLTDIDLPWTPDGIRDRGHEREAMHRRFLDELTQRRLPFVLISGPPDERLRQAVKAIDGLVVSHE
jgi:nicotinamide riboside kinase